METGKEKVDRICELLKEETIKPAQEEAKKLLNEARQRADQVLKDALNQKAQILKDADIELDKKKKIFDSSLALASKNTLETLKQSIEKNLFSEEINRLVMEKSSDETVISDFIRVVTESIEKEGLGANIEVAIPKGVSKEKLMQLLAAKVRVKFESKQVLEEGFAGGAKIKLLDHRMTIDLSDQALKELLVNFLQKDYRQIIFNV